MAKSSGAPDMDPETRASVERLFDARPDLATQQFASLSELKSRAVRRDSLVHCAAHLNRLDLEVIGTLMIGGPMNPERLAHMAGDVPVDALAESLERLNDRWLVGFDGGLWRAEGSGVLGDFDFTGLGKSVEVLAGHVAEHELNNALRKLGRPAQATRTKIVYELQKFMSDAEAMREVLVDAPKPVQQIIRELTIGPAHMRLPYASAARYQHSNLNWLTDRGLLLPSAWGMVELPREAGITLRGGRVIEASGWSPPTVAVQPVDNERADDRVSQQVLAGLGIIEDVCVAVDRLAVRCLKAGGVGAREVKRIAALIERDEHDAAVLLEVAAAANLISPVHVRMPAPKTKAGKPSRTATPDAFEELTTTERFTQWRKDDIGTRWLLVARSWLAVTRHLSAAGRRNIEDKLVNVLDDGVNRGQHHACRRFAVLQSLRTLNGQRLVDSGELTEYIEWHANRLFERTADEPEDAEGGVIGDLLNEAEVLGLWFGDHLSPLAAMLLDAQFDEAVAYINRVTPEPAREVMIQADGSILIAGVPDPDMLEKLLAFARIKSRDVATIMHVDESSIREALDSGRSVPEIMDVLTAHSSKDVPQSVSYLINDVARRHGQLSVGGARAFVQSDDLAVLADVVRNKALAKFNLKQIAPTIAIADAGPIELLEALRSAGFLPTLNDESAMTLTEVPQRWAVGSGKPAYENTGVAHAVSTPATELVDQAFKPAPAMPDITDEQTQRLRDEIEPIIAAMYVDAGMEDSVDNVEFGAMPTEPGPIADLIIKCWVQRTALCIATVTERSNAGEPIDMTIDILHISQYDGGQLSGQSVLGSRVTIEINDIAWVIPVYPSSDDNDWQEETTQ